MSVLRAAAPFALLALLALPASAQQQASGQIQPNETKNVGDWEVRCFPVKSPSPCDMFELLADKRTGRRVLSLSIAYVPQADRHAIQIAVPLGVQISRGLVVTSDAYTSPQLQYRRCDRGGCYVEGLIDNSSIDALGRSQNGAKVRFWAFDGRGGHEFDLPFSLNGFAEARSTMAELSKAHVTMASKMSGGKAQTQAPAPTDQSGAQSPQ